MTDLTEQWKKGELPEGVYYCDTGNTVKTLFTWGKNYHQLTNNKDEVYIPEMDDCEVLSAVPSYEEYNKLWQANKEVANRNIDLIIKLNTLKERNGSLNNRDINLCRIANGIRDENFALKKLLKEWVQFEIEENPNDFTVMSERMSELANKTKEMLK
jgi:hypothetical protein